MAENWHIRFSITVQNVLRGIFPVLFFLFCGCLSSDTSIKDDLEIEVAGAENSASAKLVFIEHGLESNKRHPVVTSLKTAFLKNGYTVVTFNAHHSLGTKSRDVENARLATFQEDLNSVIKWAKKQDFYHEPFAVAGHSLGGGAALSFTLKNPDKVDLAVGVAPLLSGVLWERACFKYKPDFCAEWKKNGMYLYPDKEKREEIKISYKTLEDAKKFNLIASAQFFKTRVLLIASENDVFVPKEDIRLFYDKISSLKKEIVVIKNSRHNFATAENRYDMENVLTSFLAEHDR